MAILLPREEEIRAWFIFCGLGGGKKGFLRGTARVGHVTGKVRCIGGVDSDPASIRDFDAMGPGKGTVLDLFSRDQYIKFHERTPPVGWREATPADIRRSANGERPHIAFGSAPCKGFSGLLPEKAAGSQKYRALNELALRGLKLSLDAWKDDPVDFWLWENVPRIQTRGRAVLDEMVELLESYGYATSETVHDCGELGGLGQHRNRFLLVCRHREKVPPFLYQPPRRRVRTVGEVLGDAPLPDDAGTGPMHRMRRLQRKTWERLAFVRAGSDWRSLKDLRVENGVLKDFALMPMTRWHRGVLGVTPWDAPASTVTSTARPMNGSFSVADPRVLNGSREGQLGVNDWHAPSRTVTGEGYPTNGRFAVADPRIDGHHKSVQLGVIPFDTPAPTVTGQMWPGQGPFSVADPRPDNWDSSRAALGVNEWNEPSPTIIGVRAPGQGKYSVADPRLQGERPRFNNVYRVVSWDQTSQAVTAGEGPSAGGQAVADPRYERFGQHYGKMRVEEWHEPAHTITGSDRVGSGALSVADPRAATDWGGKGKYCVTPFDGVANTVIAASATGNGAYAVADPRTSIDRQRGDNYLTSRNYGIVPWDSPMGVVSAAACHDNGAFSVADPRLDRAEFGDIEPLPGPEDRLVMIIIALDGTWHRPFTTFELALLQGLCDPRDYLELHGTSDTAWRERIGNAVPPPAAEAIANQMVETLLLAWAGETFMLSEADIWVRPMAIALSVDAHQELPQ